MKEITFELTNYCQCHCRFCSSKAKNDLENSSFLSFDRIKEILDERVLLERINLSGGEPLAHPRFFDIFMLCREHVENLEDIVVYTNLWNHRRYNAQAIDGVYLEADITVTPETDKINILRRVKQGKEANRPNVHLSKNHFVNCQCDHRVIRPDGSVTLTPCNKNSERLEENEILNKIFVIGAHGVGKSTLIKETSLKLNVNFYENDSRNPYKENVKQRQLWRLLKYSTDYEMLRTFTGKTLVNRCCIDWLVYTTTFKKLGWISEKDFNMLMEKYNLLFQERLPVSVIFLNPDIEWSKDRIAERWKEGYEKWRERDFVYYRILRETYENIISDLKKIVKVIEIKDISKSKRLNEMRKLIVKM